MLLYLFGYLAYLLPVLSVHLGCAVYRGELLPHDGAHLYRSLIRFCGFGLAVAGGGGLATLHFPGAGVVPLDSGGVIGDLVGKGLAGVFGDSGASLFLLALFLTGITLLTSISWLTLMDAVGRCTVFPFAQLRTAFLGWREQFRAGQARRKRESTTNVERKGGAVPKRPRIAPMAPRLAPSLRAAVEKQEVALLGPLADDAPHYINEVIQGEAADDSPVVAPGLVVNAPDAESDPLYHQAVFIVTGSRHASVSWMQRRLRIGYNRAARMIERMEESGIVGPLQANGSRDVIAPLPVEV